jgi:hypothetical protein
MAKKHRVKRQKYVEHLLAQEKNREAYLEKRRAPKRSREMRNNEEVSGEGQELMESKALKKRRTEAATEEHNESDEERHRLAPSRASASATWQKPSLESATPAAAAQKAFFSAPPFAAQVTDSAKTATATESSATMKVGVTKKSLKRHHY